MIFFNIKIYPYILVFYIIFDIFVLCQFFSLFYPAPPGLQAIITLAHSVDPDVHQHAAAALRGLAVTFSNKMKIVQEGALNPLAHLLLTQDVEILREVSG